MTINPRNESTSVTITNGALTSTSAVLGGGTAVALEIPSVTAATFTIQKLGRDGSTWFTIYDDAGTAYTITATDNALVVLDPTKMVGAETIRLIGNTNEAGGDVSIGVISRGV